MGNQPNQTQTQAQVHSSPPAVNTPNKQEQAHFNQHPTVTIETLQRVDVERVEQSRLQLTDQQKIFGEAPPKRQEETVSKTVSLPALLSHPKRKRSIRQIEEIRSGKQNSFVQEAQPTASKLEPLTQPRQGSYIQVSDLRENEEGGSEVKQFRVKKIRVSKNSLHCPGAYF